MKLKGGVVLTLLLVSGWFPLAWIKLSGSSTEATAPYATAGTLNEPRLFAEGIVSTNTDEFGATFSPDGRTVFFSKSVPRSNLYMICVSHFQDGTWSSPEIAPFSGQYWDFDPFFAPDGSKLFFASDRPVPGKPQEDRDFDIWMVEKTASGWSEPKNLGTPVNSDSDEAFASVATDGTLYFTSTRPGRDFSTLAVYRSKFVDGKYKEPEKLSEVINVPANASLEVVIAPDQSFLLICPFGRPDGRGSSDIYISYNRNGVLTPPENLGPKVNTRAREYSPRLSPDGKYLFFTSERGFATNPLETSLSYPELEKGLRSVQNGWGNIWQIELSALGLEIHKR